MDREEGRPAADRTGESSLAYEPEGEVAGPPGHAAPGEVLVATFNKGTRYEASKGIVWLDATGYGDSWTGGTRYEASKGIVWSPGEGFRIHGAGPITPAHVLYLNGAGDILWRSRAVREWFYSQFTDFPEPVQTSHPQRAQMKAETSTPTTKTSPTIDVSLDEKNTIAVVGLALGIASLFLYWIGVVPIIAVVVSGIGWARSRDLGGTGKTASIAGLVLGAVFTLAYLYEYGYLG